MMLLFRSVLVAPLLLSQLAVVVQGQAGNACEVNEDCGSRYFFCGKDGTCRAWSCSDWYDFGPTNFTGNDGMTPPIIPFSCQNLLMNPPDVNDVGATYRCVSLDPPPLYADFTSKCTAQPTASERFECLEYRDDTDFSFFLSQVETSGFTCADDQEVPGYYYTTMISSNIGTTFNTVFYGEAPTDVFDETIAKMTISSTLSSDDTEFPTMAPSSGGAIQNSFTWLVFASVLLLVYRF